MKNNILNIKNYVQKHDRQIIWGMVLLTGLVAFFCFYYYDVLITVEHSFNLLDCIRQGNVLSFYQYAIEHNSFQQPAVYDIPIYFIFAIWNFPLYIIHKLTGIDYMYSLPCLIWIKSMLVVWMLLSGCLVKRICKEIEVDKEREKWTSLYFFSSVFLIVPVLIIVQYDIIAITFMLAGILAYIKNENRRFIVFFMFAITLKLFAIFVFVPLLLLKEKRIIKIFIKMVEGCSLLLLCKIVFRTQVAYKSSTSSFATDMINRLQTTSIQWIFDDYKIPLFIVLLFGVCIFCYAKKCKDDMEFKMFAVYVPYIVFGGFISLVRINPYWIVLFAPFSTILILKNINNAKLNIIIDTILGGAICFVFSFLAYWVFSVSTLQRMCISKLKFISSNPKYLSLYNIWDSMGISSYTSIFAAIIVVCFISGAILNYPSCKFSTEQIENNKIYNIMIWVRLVPSVLIMALLIFAYCYPADNCVYSTVDNENTVLSENLLVNGDVNEIVYFEDNYNVDSITVYVNADGYIWLDSSVIVVSVYEDDKCIESKEVPANMLSSGEIKLNMDGYEIREGNPYRITIHAYNECDKPIYVKLNSNINKNLTKQNGDDIQADLQIQITGNIENDKK